MDTPAADRHVVGRLIAWLAAEYIANKRYAWPG